VIDQLTHRERTALHAIAESIAHELEMRLPQSHDVKRALVIVRDVATWAERADQALRRMAADHE
jgi:hypothetical protein